MWAKYLIEKGNKIMPYNNFIQKNYKRRKDPWTAFIILFILVVLVMAYGFFLTYLEAPMKKFPKSSVVEQSLASRIGDALWLGLVQIGPSYAIAVPIDKIKEEKISKEKPKDIVPLSPVPEPGTLLLLGTGIGAFGLYNRFRRKE